MHTVNAIHEICSDQQRVRHKGSPIKEVYMMEQDYDTVTNALFEYSIPLAEMYHICNYLRPIKLIRGIEGWYK